MMPVASTSLPFNPIEPEENSPDTNAILPIINRFEHIKDSIDPLLPNAPEIMRERVKEITTLAIDVYKKLLSEQIETAVPLSSPQVYSTKSSQVTSLTIKVVLLFSKVIEIVPSTIEELEYSLRTNEIMQKFWHQMGIAGEAGAQEKEPTPKEVAALHAFHLRENRFDALTSDFKVFLDQEKARLQSSEHTKHPVEPLNLNSFVTVIETGKELSESFMLRIHSMRARAVTLSQIGVSKDQIFELLIKEVEKWVDEPATAQKLRTCAPLLHQICYNLLPQENVSPTPFSKEILEKHSKDDLCTALIIYAVISLIPDTFQQLKPFFLQLCRTNFCKCVGQSDEENIFDTATAIYSNVQPSTELGKRFVEFYLQALHKHFPPKRPREEASEGQSEEQMMMPPSKKNKLG